MLGAKPPSSPTLVAEKREKKKTLRSKTLTVTSQSTQTPINHKLTLFQVVPLCTGVVITKING